MTDRVKDLEFEVEKLQGVIKDLKAQKPATTGHKLSDLSAPFEPNEIEWRILQAFGDGQNISAKCVPYLTARAVMDRLDKVVGVSNWQDKYEIFEGGAICYLSIRIAGDWITKADGAAPTEIEGFKGCISDALKRAAVKFGIGRDLYAMDDVWAEISLTEKSWNYAKNKSGQVFYWRPKINFQKPIQQTVRTTNVAPQTKR